VTEAARRFFRDNARWLAAGMLLTFASSAGQTFFIALFAEPLRAATGLGHGGWGTLYAVATLGSALTIASLGHLADRRPMAVPAVGVVGLLALGALAAGGTGPIWLLGLAVFALRFAGQGMAGHVAITAAARWFAATRGRAIAVVMMGHPIGEAILPGIVVAAMATIGWRATWLALALGLALVILPLVAWLGAVERTPRRPGAVDASRDHLLPGLDGRHWGRRQVLRHPIFWALVPGVLASPFMGTAVLFQAGPLMAAKGWSLELYAAAFPVYAACSVAGAFLAGVLVDRLGAVRLLPFVLLPLATALLLVATADMAPVLFAVLGLIGMTTGAVQTLMSALWAELYGTRNLGAVRGLVSGFTVFGTALSPGVTGLLLDVGVPLEAQFGAMGAVALVLSAGFTLVTRLIHERHGVPA